MDEEILEAARDGDVREVRRLVGEGANPEAADIFSVRARILGTTPLHYASSEGRVSVVQYLVGEVQVDVEKTDHLGRTALHSGCRRNRLSIVRYLIETGGARIDARDIKCNTPLHLASLCGNTEVVRYLVEQRQTNVNATNRAWKTPLDWAIVACSEDELVRCLLRRSFVSKKDLVALWSLRNHYCLVDIRVMALERYGLGRGLDSAFRQCPIHTLFSQYPLPSAKAFQESIELFPSSVLSLRDRRGRLPIHVALTSRNKKVKCPVMIALLFDQNPRSALARDPTTGLYPHLTAAGLDSKKDDRCWLDIIYRMLRSNPQPLLQSRMERQSLRQDGEGTIVR